MADPDEYDDPGPMVPAPPSRVRRALTVAILVMLIVSMVFLAFVSGRGVIRVKPDAPPTPKAQPVAARAASSDPVVEFPIHHVEREEIARARALAADRLTGLALRIFVGVAIELRPADQTAEDIRGLVGHQCPA